MPRASASARTPFKPFGKPGGRHRSLWSRRGPKGRRDHPERDLQSDEHDAPAHTRSCTTIGPDDRRYDAGVRALIVEDDRTIAEFVARGLREAGFAVDSARDGDEGLAAALARPTTSLIVDLMLPGRDGLSIDRRAAPSWLAQPRPDLERPSFG